MTAGLGSARRREPGFMPLLDGRYPEMYKHEISLMTKIRSGS